MLLFLFLQYSLSLYNVVFCLLNVRQDVVDHFALFLHHRQDLLYEPQVLGYGCF